MCPKDAILLNFMLDSSVFPPCILDLALAKDYEAPNLELFM